MTTVYACRGDGLGTRLLTILHGRILADLLDFDFKVAWPPLGAPFYDNSDILHPNLRHEFFSKECVFEGAGARRGEIVDPSSFSNERLFGITQNYKNVETMNLQSFKESIEGYDGIWYDQPYPLPTIMGSNVNVEAAIKYYWKTISWNRDLSKFMEDLRDNYSLDEAISVHVRRGDIVRTLREETLDTLISNSMIQIFQRYAALATILRVIGSFRSDEKIFICTEDKGMKQSFIQKYGAQNCYSSLELFSGTENQRAFVDLMILSQSKILVAPYMSFFSICAAAVGRCEYKSVGLDPVSLVEELLGLLAPQDSDRNRSVSSIVYATAARMMLDPVDANTREQFVRYARSLDANISNAILTS